VVAACNEPPRSRRRHRNAAERNGIGIIGVECGEQWPSISTAVRQSVWRQPGSGGQVIGDHHQPQVSDAPRLKCIIISRK
jgi:hypothetical protein